MKQSFGLLSCALVSGLLLALSLGPVHADAPAADGKLLDFGSPDLLTQNVEMEHATVTVNKDGESPVVVAEYEAGKGYPAVRFHGPWDLTGYKGLQVTVKNTGKTPAQVVLRVDDSDNWQSSPWNTQTVGVQPGNTQTIKVVFGQSEGRPGYALSPASVLRALVFVINPDGAVQLTISDLKAFK
jgi:hypothetical protein